MVLPRIKRASRICQNACLPDPKTARYFNRERRLKSNDDARAVRKAVSSSALIKPMGSPTLDIMVKDPRVLPSVVVAFSTKVITSVGGGMVTTVEDSC